MSGWLAPGGNTFSVHEERAHFTGLVVGSIEADLSDEILIETFESSRKDLCNTHRTNILFLIFVCLFCAYVILCLKKRKPKYEISFDGISLKGC